MAEENKKTAPLIDDENVIQLLREVVVPEKMYRRVLMDIEVIDKIFGGEEMPGLVLGTTILMTGMPGAGKSTAALQFADRIQRNAGKNVLLNIGEEHAAQVKMRADRIAVDGNFSISLFRDVNDLIDFCKETGVEVLFIDSIQQLTDREHPDEGPKPLLRLVGKKLHRFAKKTDTIVFIIGHITKGGDFAGPMELKHDLDVHAHMRLTPTQNREFLLTKNRWGPSGISYEFGISKAGIDFAHGMVMDKQEEEASSATERRDKIVALIKEKLLAGEKVSGYCFNRFVDPITQKMGIEISGNVWRTLIERAKGQLQAEGHIVSEVKIDNRTHTYVEI